MPFRLKVFQKGLILVGVPLLIELCLIGGLSYLLYESEQEKKQEMRYRRGAVVTAHLVALTAEVPLLMAGALEYQSDKLFKSYEKNLALIEENNKEVERIRAECPEVRVPFKEDLQKQQGKILAMSARYASARKSTKAGDTVASLVRLSQELNATTTESSDDLSQLAQHGETETAKTRQKQERISHVQNWILLIGVVANILVAVFLAIFYQRSILSRILTITNNTIALSQGENMSAPLTGADEIALVDHSFHTMHDQLLAASARERALFENAIDVICVLNEKNEIQKINPICEENWGYSSEDLVETSISNLLTPADFDLMKSRIAEAKLKAEPVQVECKIITKHGGEREVLWSAYWSDAEQSLFCTVHDLTEQKQVDRAKSQFLNLISSDLKRPLNSIADTLKRLIDTSTSALTEQANSKLSAICVNIQRLVELVNDLLQMNDLPGARASRPLLCNIQQTLRRAADDVTTLAEEKQIQLIINPTAHVQDWEVDSNRIIQVLVNLLSNAIKFSPNGSTISISAEPASDFILCKVRDQGRGVPDSDKKSIFEKFEQVQTSDGKRKAGTGLGLPICKQIIEEQGGEIGVENNEDQGSCFWFRVPKDQDALKRIRSSEPVNSSSLPSADAPSEIAKKKTASITIVQQFSTRLGLVSKGVLLVAIPVICEIVLVACLADVLKQVDQERAFELRERLISNYANAIMINCIDAQVRIGHAYSPEEWQKILKDIDAAHKSRDKLNRLAKNDRRELAYALKAEESFKELDESYARAETAAKEKRNILISFTDRHATLPALLKLFHNLDKVIEIAESKELQSPAKQQALRQSQANVLAFGLAANILTAFLLALYFGKDINSRLMLLADNAGRLAREKDLNPQQIGFDEIAKLDQIFHVMAEALAAARNKERAIFDNSKDIICVIDATGRFLSINPACEKTWGYSRESILQDKTIAEITLTEDVEKTKAMLLSESNKDSHIQFENRIVKRSGDIVHTLWSCSKNKNEPVLYCIAHDISARKALEAMKQEFLSMVSHDLRSPLTAILGTTQLTATGAFGTVPDAEAALLSQVNQNCRGLVELISDLLDLEKLDAGKMRLSMEEVELADVINKAIQNCKDKDRVKLEYTLELDETVLLADPDRLTQALSSVLNFTVNHSDDKVRVRLENKGDLSYIQIFDSAAHLSEEACHQIFDRFANNDSSSGSSRLSMPLALKIIEAHNGTLQINKHEGGNLFVIKLANELMEG